MRAFLSNWIAFVVLLCLCVSNASAIEFSGGSASEKHSLPSGSLNVKISTCEVNSGYPFKTGFRWGGEESERPRRVINDIDIGFRNSNLFVPLSAYSDLGDPRELQIVAKKGGFALIIRGGDAAGGYEAVLTFIGGQLNQRRVSSGEFPKQVWEVTRYSFNKLDN